jgi:hypothetical protein
VSCQIHQYVKAGILQRSLCCFGCRDGIRCHLVRSRRAQRYCTSRAAGCACGKSVVLHMFDAGLRELSKCPDTLCMSHRPSAS